MSTLLAPAPAPVRLRASASAAPAHQPDRWEPAPYPARPEVRPARPEVRPAQPDVRPGRPSTRPARPGHLRVVQPGERTRRRLTPVGGVVLTAMVFVVLAALAGAHTLIAQGQIRLDELDGQLRTEQARYQELRKDVAGMESPERIVAAAEAQGMVTPDDLVYLQPDEAATTGTSQIDAGSTSRADTPVARPTSRPWASVKPMLESTAP